MFMVIGGCGKGVVLVYGRCGHRVVSIRSELDGFCSDSGVYGRSGGVLGGWVGSERCLTFRWRCVSSCGCIRRRLGVRSDVFAFRGFHLVI